MPPPAASVNSAAPVKSGSSALKIVLVVVLLGGAGLVAAAGAAFYYGRNRLAAWRNGSSSTASSTGSSMPFSAMARAMERHASAAAFGQAALLSKEEVGSIIGVPVTSIEMSGKSDATYKTEKVGLEASIEIERKNGDADAIQSMDGARQVTRQAFGGKAEKVDGIGDEALYGAFNVLYVRKNDVFLTIMPPNLQMAAQQEQASKMFAQPLGSDAQVKELEKLKETMKNDPVKDSLAKPDAVSGAAGLIHSAAAERGGEYETRSRLMARQMAEKVLAKIGT
jgi:hypothetical protein